jgi:hypothetical protein
MGTKLEKNTLPAGHTREDFKGHGPVVTEDTVWGGANLADLGCFKQDEGTDSNKYYHLAVVESTITPGKFFAYYEWGRTKPDGRPNKPAFQFFDCSSQADAQATCEKQFTAKNTRRGEMEQVGSKQRLVPKVKRDKSGTPKRDKDGNIQTEDLYVVRPLATRLVGLPCCQNIANEDAQGAAAKKKAPAKGKKKPTGPKRDPQTKKLFADLMGGVQTYSRAFLGAKSGPVTLPSQTALDDARDILTDAQKHVGTIEASMSNATEAQLVQAQVSDGTLMNMTKLLYGIIPKAIRNPAPEDYILNTSNILRWQDDIDVLETALQGADMDVEEDTTDPLAGIPADVRWIPKGDELYDWLVGQTGNGWWPKATRGRSGVRGGAKLKVHGLWEVQRHGDRDKFRRTQQAIAKEMDGRPWNEERPLFYDKKRPDLTVPERQLFWNCNTSLLFHGTRTVNVPGIVRENLRFPKELTGVVINGAMFGPGSYFADDWAKSAGYCSHRQAYYGGGGAVSGRHSFMFGFDVVLGIPHVAEGSKGFKGAPRGTHCVFGKYNHTRSWGGTLANNEWIIYVKGQCEMRYLAEVSW